METTGPLRPMTKSGAAGTGGSTTNTEEAAKTGTSSSRSDGWIYHDDGDDDDDDDDAHPSITAEAFHIQCDACQRWFDATELEAPLTPAEAAQLEVWHCDQCIPYKGPSRRKKRGLRQGLRRNRHQHRVDYAKLNDPASLLEDETGASGGGKIGVAANDVQETDFENVLRQRQKKGVFKKGEDGCLLVLDSNVRQQQHDFDLTAHAKEHGFDRPVLIDAVDNDKEKNSSSCALVPPRELGLRLPPRTSADGGATPFSYADVAELVGPYRRVQVMDTATQLATQMTVREFADYMAAAPAERTRVLNIITLEFSRTPLAELVTEPKFARDVDLVGLHWPSSSTTQTAAESGDDRSSLSQQRPRVSKYCLMSAAGSYTDFHVDFGGTSVWYHVYTGQKVFYFIEPTPENRKIYSRWATNSHAKTTATTTKKQQQPQQRIRFLPDAIVAAGGSVYEVPIHQGQTLFIPSGWIHAVYTPIDSLVFGGNFLHVHSFEMQLNTYRLEQQMRVGKEYQFPNYQALLWYTARDFLRQCCCVCSAIGADVGNDDKPMNDGDNIGSSRSSDGQQLEQFLCTKYPRHVLRGYRALAKELERWSASKTRHVIEQYPAGMDVVRVASELGRITKLCVAYLDQKERDRLKRQREQLVEERRKERDRLKRQRERLVEEEKKRGREKADALAKQKKAKREMEKAAKVLERRKALESQYEEVTWAQCDQCDEWHEVSLEVLQQSRGGTDEGAGDEHPFFCSDVGGTCKASATKWMQCTVCMAWHTVTLLEEIDVCRQDAQEDAEGRVGAVGGTDVGKATKAAGFTCEDAGKKCGPKKYRRAKLALCS